MPALMESIQSKMNPKQKKKISYSDAGVDLERGYSAVARIKKIASSTFGQGVLSSIGEFSGLFSLHERSYEEPVLAAGADGVGTKLKIAFLLDKHDTVGIDCVAMCANDVLCSGAEPIFFLDYLAMGRLESGKIEQVIGGVARGCQEAGCALLGGETAEMPGLYRDGEYDLAGFCVGLTERKSIFQLKKGASGDCLIGLASSGLHSNGFSLLRKIFGRRSLERRWGDGTLGETLLTPTRLYVRSVLPLVRKGHLKGIAHITGGGFIENIPRTLPEGVQAEIRLNSWPIPEIFSLIIKKTNLEDEEMFKTFNMGIGMVLVVNPRLAEEVLEDLRTSGEKAYVIGRVTKKTGGARICFR